MAKHFTKREIDEIEQALIERSKKDTSLPQTDHLSGGELLPVIQNGENKTVSYSILDEKVSETATSVAEEMLDSKVDKIPGKSLSTNDYTDVDKQKVADSYQKPSTGIPTSDIAEGVIPDVSQFVTRSVNDLINYYLKSEVYTQRQVDSLIETVSKLSYVVADVLPSASADTMYKIYLIPSSNPKLGNVKDEFFTIRTESHGEYVYYWEQFGSTSIDLDDYITTEELNTALASYTTTANLTELLSQKQDVISDLSSIRSGAAAGSTAYQKPSSGIPKSDLTGTVQTSLDKADSSLQFTTSGEVNPQITPADYATIDELNQLGQEINKKLSASHTEQYGSDDYVNLTCGVGSEIVVDKEYAPYYGIIIDIKTASKIKITSNIANAYTFSNVPYYGMPFDGNRVRRFLKDTEYTLQDNEKYLLVTLKTDDYPTLSVDFINDGIGEDVKQAQQDIEEIKFELDAHPIGNGIITENLDSSDYANLTIGVGYETAVYSDIGDYNGYVVDLADCEQIEILGKITNAWSFNKMPTFAMPFDGNRESQYRAGGMNNVGVNDKYLLITININNPNLVIKKYTKGIATDVDKLKESTLNGSTIVCFGDSLTAMIDSEYYCRYTDYLHDISGATIINAGIGGTSLRQRGVPVETSTTEAEAYRALDISSLFQAIANNDFSKATAAANFINEQHTKDVITTLSSMDWDSVDAITIFAGTNDWTQEVIGTSGSTDISTTLGAVYQIVNLFCAAHPNIRIYYFNPIPRGRGSDYSDTKVIGGYTLRQLAKALYDEFLLYHVPSCDMYNTIGINQFNFDNFFESDSVHPHTYNGEMLIAKKIMTFLVANKTF